MVNYLKYLEQFEMFIQFKGLHMQEALSSCPDKWEAYKAGVSEIALKLKDDLSQSDCNEEIAQETVSKAVQQVRNLSCESICSP